MTIIIVTHNIQQVARVSDFTAFMYLGEMIECGPTNRIFRNPKKNLQSAIFQENLASNKLPRLFIQDSKV